ncbi:MULTISPECIES: ankyrin repeat domain-containing protein [Flavobacterium]|uniref:Ankyrin repeat domain-containing protein n=1 Tax=Flavobacterium stagni TaxID=2506421 RepID=A0A4Q1KEE2_9FLAO|nr:MULTISPECIES: ankyrin repeat domain-containing protein [Flavobacterium]RXR24078.1 ankyrin repeat domain-containing protein [Flavobacterium stagni]
MKGLIFALISSVSIWAQSTPDVFEIARKGTENQAKEALLQNKNCFNLVNSEGFTPLILACYKGNIPVAKCIIASGVAINYNSPMGSALMAATVKGNLELVNLLLTHQADPNLADDQGNTALIYAAMFQNVEIVKLLLSHGAHRDAKDEKGQTAFEHAVKTGNEQLIQLLKH